MRGRKIVFVVALIMAVAAGLASVPAFAQVLQLGISDAAVAYNDRGLPKLQIRVVEESKRPLRNFSQAYVGRAIELHINGENVCTSVFREPLMGGVFLVTCVQDMDGDRLRGVAGQLAEPGNTV
jgi:hypothetical protein